METNNVLLLVGDNDEDLKSFESKLMLLRDVDTILHSKIQDAYSLCQSHVPDSVIIFIEKEDDRVFELCKSLKNDLILKNIPVLFVMQEFNQEIALSGFDAGISDYISFPLSDSDVLVRVIWALQKSEDIKKLEKQETLLSNLNVVYKNIGIYTQKFTQEVLKNEIESTKKYKKKVTLMAVSLDYDFQGVVPLEKLAAIIKKSTRASDIIGLCDKKTFLVLMQKTNKEGAKTVYSRIQASLGDVTASAAAVEYELDMEYPDMNKIVLERLQIALSQINSIIVSSDNVNLPDSDMQTKETDIEEDKSEDIQVEDQKNYKLFAQAFSKKSSNVIEPVFEEAKKRYQEIYEENVEVKTKVSQEECIFLITDTLTKNQAELKLVNEGLAKVLVDVSFTKDNQTTNNNQKAELKDIDEAYLLGLLDKINEQFESLVNV